MVRNWSQNLFFRDHDQDHFKKIKEWKDQDWDHFKKIKKWKNQDQDHREKITSSDLDHAKNQDQLHDLDLLDQDQWSFCISDHQLEIIG